MNADATLKALCKQQAVLGPQILQFNFNFIDYLHASRLPAYIQPAWLATLQHSQRGKRLFNSLLQNHFNLAGQFCFDFSDPVRRLVLLDQPTLQRLIMTAGTAYYADFISKLIEKSKIQQIKASLGENYYLFAIKRASILFKNKPNVPLPAPDLSNLASTIFQAGKELLERVLEGEPLAILKRFELKFEHSLSWVFQHATSPEIRGQIGPFLKKLITHEVNPSLASCFN